MTIRKVAILRGLPGSGKDTFINSLAKENGIKVEVVSADDWFTRDGGDYIVNFNPQELGNAHADCFRRYMEAFDNPNLDCVAVSNTNMKLFEMSPYILFANTKKVPVVIYNVNAGATAKEYAEFNNHGVPFENIVKMIDSYEETPLFWPEPVCVRAFRDGQVFLIGVKPGGSFTRRIPAHT